MSVGLHQHRLRKQKNKTSNKLPSSQILDKVIFVIAFLGPIFTLDQVYKIYHFHDATGVSLFTWASFATFNIFWIFYGVKHKEKVIILAYSLWFIVNSTVAIGAFMYG